MIPAALALILAAGSAGALELTSPVDCDAVGGCYIQSYPDRDPGPGYADHACGALSYDGHKGTDFRVRTNAEMHRGVPVIAAAPGTVRAFRNDEPDMGVDGMTPGRECGNGLVLTHEGGWESQYCHLARGSIIVAHGQRVERGDRLGLMGYSGATAFPHVHFELRRDGDTIDPFDARPLAADCALPDAGLWRAGAATYVPGGPVDAGLTGAPPDLAAIRDGALPGLANDPPALVFWARFYGLSKGDRLIFRLTGPDGEPLAASEQMMDRPRAEQMRFVGVRRPKGGWPSGAYEGRAQRIAPGQAPQDISATITLR